MLTRKDLDELEDKQPWAHLSQEEHHDLFRLARLGLRLQDMEPCPHGYTGGTLCQRCKPGLTDVGGDSPNVPGVAGASAPVALVCPSCQREGYIMCDACGFKFGEESRRATSDG